MQAKVLIVDDEAVVRMTLEHVLTRAGFAVDAAVDGVEAEARLGSGAYDVAVVDLRMPGVDGFEVLAWMREHAPDVVPIVLSGTSRIEDATKAVQQGAFDFVSKRFEDPDVFLQHIRRAVEHKRLRDSRDRLLGELNEKNAELENRLSQLALAHGILQSQAVAIQVDLNRAMRIQHGLLPQHVPFSDRISVAAFYRPMAKVGGDLYDLFQLDDTHVGLYVADTSGHGVSSAMLTVFLKHAVHGIVRPGKDGRLHDPGEVLCELNRTFITEAFGQGVFVSMTYVMLDMVTMGFRYSSAGHPPPLLRRAGGGIERLHRPAPVLGVNPSVLYADGEGSLQTGDMLVLYTDGITEARDGAGTFFGEERLKDTIRAAEMHADCIEETVQREMSTFCAGCPCTDDATLVVLGVEPQRKPLRIPEELAGPTPVSSQRTVKVLTAKQEGRAFISIAGSGSWRESQQILNLCEDARQTGAGSVILDFSHCSHLDSTFLGVLHNIAASFDQATPGEASRCRFEVQNLPRSLLREMSALGLTSVLMHFRPEPIPLPESMEPVEGGMPAGEELGRLLLWAHEALVEADPSNADRFAAVLQVLHDRAKTASRNADAPQDPSA